MVDPVSGFHLMEIWEPQQFGGSREPTWMSQEVRKSMVRINGLQPINGVYWSYNPLKNHLQTSWDFQAVPSTNEKWCATGAQDTSAPR